MGKRYTVRQLRTPEEQAVARLADVENRRQRFEDAARRIEITINVQMAEAFYALKEPFEQTSRAMRSLLAAEEKLSEEVKKIHEAVQDQAGRQAPVLLEGRRVGRGSTHDARLLGVWQGGR
jgi:hypothetical protein